MGNKFSWNGMEEFKAQLRKLPDELSDEGGDIVLSRANEAIDEIRSAYEAHRDSGDLISKLRLDVNQQSAGASATAKSTARHAYIFENGTQVRKNAAGANRGAMPPANIFIPVMVRKRRAMNEDLIALLKKAGLEVRLG